MRLLVVISAMMLFGVAGTAKAQGWRGIVPLHSSCDDAKKILKYYKV